MNKRSMEEMNLRAAFPPMPETCQDALMRAARSVKEEKPMKRKALHAALMAALLLAATLSVALAATQLGLSDFFGHGGGAALPDSARPVLSQTLQKTYAVGPLSITLRETLADGRLVYVTTQVAQEKAAVYGIDNDPDLPIPDSVARQLNVEKGLTFQAAAQQAQVPLYRVFSYLTLDESLRCGEEMMGSLYGEDGGLLLVDMLQTLPDAVGDSVTGVLTLRVQEMDPVTAQPMPDRDWQTEETLTLPVNGVTAEKIYFPEGEALVAGYTLEQVQAEQTCAGVYLTALFTAPENADKEQVYALYDVNWQDAQGLAFPNGISLSGEIKKDNWPKVELLDMIGLDDLPDALRLFYRPDETTVVLQ